MAKRTSRKPKRRTYKRMSRNGWGRRASASLKGKRRSRAKRTSRRNGLDRAKIQKALAHVHLVEKRSDNRSGLDRAAAVKQAIAEYSLNADEANVLLSATHVQHSEISSNNRRRASRRNTAYYYEGMSHPGSYDRRGKPRRNSRRRRSRANQTYYIPIPPIKKNGRRRRTTRRNQTYYIPIPPISKNSRLSKAKRSKLPSSKFVFPKDRAWPIESAQAARDAIKYIKMGRVRSASDFMAIRSFIIKYYPAVWKKYGLSASWQRTSRAKHRGMVHRRQHMQGRHRMAANRRRR